jgi:hypothetical protein
MDKDENGNVLGEALVKLIDLLLEIEEEHHLLDESDDES